MKEHELVAVATCALCSEKIGKSRLPLFWRVTVQRFGIKLDAIRRREGLAMMLGGSQQLAYAMGPDEDMAVEVMEPIKITVCETCAVERPFLLAAMLEVAEKKEHERTSVDLPGAS